MITEVKPLMEINKQALRLLYKELGVVNAVRFVKQYAAGFGDYTQERDALFENKTLEEPISDIERQRATF